MDEVRQWQMRPLEPCTGYLAHPFGKSRCKKDRVCLHWLQMDMQRG
jgi:hypothetical protein